MRSICFALLTHFGSTAIAAVAFVRPLTADEKIIAAFWISAAVIFARIEQQLIQIKINCLHKIATLPNAGKFFLRQVHLRSGGIDIIVDDVEQDASGKSVVNASAWNIFSENYSSKLFLRQQVLVIIIKRVQHMLVYNCEKVLQLAGVVSICFTDILEQLRVRNALACSKVFCGSERRSFNARQQVVNAMCAVMQQVGKRIDNACLRPFVPEEIALDSKQVTDDFDAAGKKTQAHNVHFVYLEQGIIHGNFGVVGSIVFFCKDISHKKGSVDKAEIVDEHRMIFVIKVCTFAKAALRRIGQAIGIAEGKHLRFIVFVNIGEGNGQRRGCSAFLTFGSDGLRMQGALGADKVVLTVKKAANLIIAADIISEELGNHWRWKGALHSRHENHLAKI